MRFFHRRVNRSLVWRLSRGVRLYRLCVVLAGVGVALGVLGGCARGGDSDAVAAELARAEDSYSKALKENFRLLALQKSSPGPAGYRIGPNDVIEIRVFEHDSLNTTVRVGGGGDISFPPLGELSVSGLTERQLEALLRDRLDGKYLADPHVTVFVKELYARSVAVVGQVKNPGLYPIFGGETIIDALAKAGGLTGKCGSFAFLIRYDEGENDALAGLGSSGNGEGGSQAIKIDLDGLLLRGESRYNVPIHAGDLVNVPDAGWVYVTGKGAVAPGTYALTRQAMSLRQVIDDSGGLKPEASKKVRLIRKREDGTEVMFRVGFDDILKDTKKDLALEQGDRIVIERSKMKYPVMMLVRGVKEVVRFGLYLTVDVPFGSGDDKNN